MLVAPGSAFSTDSTTTGVLETSGLTIAPAAFSVPLRFVVVVPRVFAAPSVVLVTSWGSSRSLTVAASWLASAERPPFGCRSARISATSVRSASPSATSGPRCASISCCSGLVLNPSADRVEVTCESVALGLSTSPSSAEE